jgi:hypothetical protein
MFKYYDRDSILNLGKDIYYYNNNGYRYEGEMKNNMREGSGMCSYFESETELVCLGIEFHKIIREMEKVLKFTLEKENLNSYA